MLQNGHEPDTFTFNRLMDRLCKESKLQEVNKLLYLMIKEGCNLNVITYNILIDGLCKQRKLDEARKLFSETSEKNISHDVVNTMYLSMVYVSKASWMRR